MKQIRLLHKLRNRADPASSGTALSSLRMWMRGGDEDDELNDEIVKAERRGLVYIYWVRMVLIAILGVWALTLPLDRSVLYLIALAFFAGLGTLSYWLIRLNTEYRRQIAALLLLIDALLLSYVLIIPAPYAVEGWTLQLNLRLWNFLWLGVFLVTMALSYSPQIVAFAGLACIAGWSGLYLWVASRPQSVSRTSTEAIDRGRELDSVIGDFLDPSVVSLTTLQYQVVFLVLVTIVMTLTVWRSRRLVRRMGAAEAQRGALSRYFSPNIVRELTSNQQALARPVRLPAAVIFADMVGFTELSENLESEELIKLLSEFHGRLARITFSHDGTVDKYIGDAIMIHFGTPRSRPDDASRALACAGDMVKEIERWNEEREAAGEPKIGIGIGCHYGEVLAGNIGEERRLEYTVLGDAVNVANRLERLTREIGTTIVVSDALVQAVKASGGDPDALIANLRPFGEHAVKGRKKPVTIWSNRLPDNNKPD